jgi:predicted GIY-YIG superfamily endonuclease
MTYNDPAIGFSQSQIAILREMPTADDVSTFQPVAMLLAPSGCKAMPDGIIEVDELLDHGWKPVMVGSVAVARVHTFSHGIRGRRLQYGFRHRIAATIHAVMGSDFNKLITSVSTMDSRYRLWEKEQVVVLLSRTFVARNTIFVGDKEDTIRALARTIQNRTQYTEYISHLLTTLCGSSRDGMALDAPFVRNDIIPFRPIDIQLPQEGSGYCYIIVSLQDMGTTYIGQAMSLVHRLNQHNRGVGSRQTADPRLRPWSLISFVCGFDRDRHLMLRFESDWERRRESMLASGAISSPEQIADVARMIMTEWNQEGIASDLRYVLAGTFTID